MNKKPKKKSIEELDLDEGYFGKNFAENYVKQMREAQSRIPSFEELSQNISNTITKKERKLRKEQFYKFLNKLTKYRRNINNIKENIPRYSILRFLFILKYMFIKERELIEECEQLNVNPLKRIVRETPSLAEELFEFKDCIHSLSLEEALIFFENLEEMYNKYLVDITLGIDDFKVPILNHYIEVFEVIDMIIPESLKNNEFHEKRLNFLKNTLARTEKYEETEKKNNITNKPDIKKINKTEKTRPTLLEMFKDEKKIEIICKKLISNGFAMIDEGKKIKWTGKTFYSMDGTGTIDDGAGLQLVALSLKIKERDYLIKAYYDVEIHKAFTEYFNYSLSDTVFKKANSYRAEYYKKYLDFI